MIPSLPVNLEFRSRSGEKLGMVPSPAVLKSMFLPPFAAVFLLVISQISTTAGFSVNHSVGGDLGWHFNKTTNTSAVNYTFWSSSISFYLGEFLIFNKDPDSTVIQTYNATTYRLCSIDQDYGNLTSQFVVEDVEEERASGGVPVELTKQGSNYFFSSSENGLQCRNGMQFNINVMHGNGLPVPSPPPPPLLLLLPPPSTTPVYRSGGMRWSFGGSFMLLLLIWVHAPVVMIP